MYGVTRFEPRFGKVVSVLVLLLLSLGLGSCAGMRVRSADADLLATGLVGWQQIGGQQGAWHFADGILSIGDEDGGWLATCRPYDNFGLSLEFRIPPGGDSGVFLRAPLEGDPAYTGLEIQILDDYAEQAAHLAPYEYTGSIYGLQGPSERVSRTAGQWQKMVVIACGTHLQVGLNGRKIVDTDLTYYAHQAGTRPGLLRQSGYLGLQSRGRPVEFRSITLRELP